MARGFEAVGLAAHPAHKLSHFRMRAKQEQRIELALQHFLREQGMHMAVTRPAKPREPSFYFNAVELTLASFVRMPRPGNQMVSGQRRHGAPAQFADAAHTLRRLTMLPQLEIAKPDKTKP